MARGEVVVGQLSRRTTSPRRGPRAGRAGRGWHDASRVGAARTQPPPTRRSTVQATRSRRPATRSDTSLPTRLHTSGDDATTLRAFRATRLAGPAAPFAQSSGDGNSLASPTRLLPRCRRPAFFSLTAGLCALSSRQAHFSCSPLDTHAAVPPSSRVRLLLQVPSALAAELALRLRLIRSTAVDPPRWPWQIRAGSFWGRLACLIGDTKPSSLANLVSSWTPSFALCTSLRSPSSPIVSAVLPPAGNGCFRGLLARRDPASLLLSPSTPVLRGWSS